MNMNPRHIMKWKLKKGKWKQILLAAAMLLIGSGVAQAQVRVGGNIYGGGEAAAVSGNDTVLIHGTDNDSIIGSVFGGGEGATANVTGYTFVSVSKGKVQTNVYGGGEQGSVTQNAHVSISGGKIGYEQDGQATVVGGIVFGGGHGTAGGKDALNKGNVANTRVEISDDAYIVNAVFGGGDNGHVLGNTNIVMTGGVVGKKITLAELITDSLEHAQTHIYTGSIMGGGRGVEKDAYNKYNDTTGRVFGNTYVTIKGGTVRHGVYGGGGLSSIGTYSIVNNIPSFTAGTGNCYVTIDSCALIGPTKKDLTEPTAAELTAAGLSTQQQYADTAFKYLGGNAGWVFGSGCGLAGVNYSHLTANDSSFVNIRGNAQVVGSVYGGGENGHVMGSTVVNVTGGIVGGLPLHGEEFDLHTLDSKNQYYHSSELKVRLTAKESEIREDEYGAGRHVFRGNVYGGGKGTDFTDEDKYSMTAGRVFGNTNVLISDSALIYNRVYGGGSLASVGTFTYYETIPTSNDLSLSEQIQRIKYRGDKGVTNVTVKGGTIGTNGLNNGDVVGGGRGLVGNPNGFDTIVTNNTLDGADQVVRMAYVKTTNVIINDGAHIKSNVYGGSLNGHVYENTLVTINGGTIGDTVLDGSAYKVHGGWHSNVYGGGGGTSRYVMANGNKHLSITSGRVYGNTKVEIKGGKVLNNVYGGGPIASVGTYDLRKDHNPIVANTGTAEVFITDGTIGYDGNENGNVFGSGLGIFCASGEYPDSLSYVRNTTVKIGTDGVATGPLVKGSVYGSGENGHVFQNTDVYMYSGTVCDNLYGAGSGKAYAGQHTHNPIGGIVIGNTNITMNGGLVKHNVYGGGEIASVGTKNFSGTSTKGQGIANIFMSGGQVGVESEILQSADDKGNVFGGGLGKPGSDHSDYANVDSTYVEISNLAYVTNSVFGGGENSHVLGNTNVNIEGGTVGRRLTLAERKTNEKNAHIIVRSGNVYGGGRGSTPYQTNPDKYSLTAGRVYGNTNVTVSGGTVRHNVYGGGALASVGTFETDPTNDTITSWTSGGKATVTIEGGLIGPTLADLMADPAKVDTAFLYLGNNEGSVYGSSRGLPEPEHSTLAFTKETMVTIKTGAEVSSGVFGGGENGHVYGNTVVVIQGGTIGGIPLHGEEFDLHTLDPASPYYSDSEYKVKLKPAESETKEDEYGVGRRIFRGAVFAGGRGSDTYNIPASSIFGKFEPTAGRVYGNSKVTVSGGTIYNNVYGGGTIASVGRFKYDATVTDSIVRVLPGTGKAEVFITGGQIGTDGNNNGDVFGGGLGVAAAPKDQLTYLAYVGETDVRISETTSSVPTIIKSNVYGGAASGHVQNNTKVTVSGGQIGYTYEDNGKTKVHGGWHSNVYGGGGGTNRYDIPNTNKKKLSISAGRVYGDTEVNIEDGATVYHNVYGGGAIASVGTYNVADPNQPPYPGYATGRGKAKVNVYGGTIGLDGNNNGMVFGSAKGKIDTINAFSDSLSYVAYSEVKIGDPNKNYAPTVKGSVYGSGENGHVYMKAKVDVNKGTIGVAPNEYQANDPLFAYRGNVYGAGCGTDTMPIPGHLYNPLSGIVQGETEVNINGGYISRNVYGGGAMASVGAYTATERHFQDTTASGSGDYHLGDTLSWPVQLDFAMGGKAVVNIYGGHIGTADLASDPLASGCVYGSSRGEAGNRYKMAALSNVREAYVTVDFDTPNSSTFNDNTDNVIIGSVFGAGENGHVYDTTSVTINKGLVAGSVFGAGEGSATYKDWLKDPSDDHLYKTDVRSITAGKVFGNTSVTVNGGWILHNVYGGGNMASVGKANYIVYGEDGDIDSTMATGRTHVRIYGGTIGTDGIENGFVFGSSRGLTFDNTNVNPRYNYNRDFFLGYTNQTFVTIGQNAVATPTASSPRIFGSVFGGGQNGHVRLNTEVVINDAEIGVQYDPSDGNITDTKWMYRGNVYGAGRGIDYVPGSTNEYCTSAGSVTRNTHVIVNGGLIHRDVYGGGSLATVGPPPVPKYLAYDPSLTTVDIIGGTIGDAAGIAKEYGGNVYGSSRGVATPNGDGVATVKEAVVNIGKKDGSTLSGTGLVNGSVYGGGKNGHVNTNATVNIYGGRVGDTESNAAKKNVYCGNVYGAGSGTDNYMDGAVEKNNNLTGIVKGNTTVTIEGGWVMRSVYGGGEMGSVGTIENDTTDAAYKHTAANQFAMSWPYEFIYKTGTGKATINVTGGRIGITGKYYEGNDGWDNGDVYGGGKGIAAPRYVEAHYANVNETEININYNELNVLPSNYKADGYVDATHGCIAGAVYGGGENGHVNTNTHITLTKGLVGHAIYGGGKGKGKYTEGGQKVYSRTAGKVFGDTRIDIDPANYDNTKAYVVRNVFGGGNLGSVGKGNYVGDTYNTTGYGETTTGATQANLDAVENSGRTYLNIYGGTIGMVDAAHPGDVFKDSIPYGTVFGGCRGRAVNSDNITDDLFGFVNNAYVTIGKESTSSSQPMLYGSVYGGGQDGHVRWNTDVTVNGGTIGLAKDATGIAAVGSSADEYWNDRGNVYGGGSGVGLYDENTYGTFSSIAGLVLQKTNVTINGGTVHRNVYGGGNLASVGPKPVGTTDCPSTLTGATVNINTNIGHSGTQYGGHVYGGSRGMPNPTSELVQKFKEFAMVSYTTVNINNGANVANAVFGGGENGQVGVDGANSMTHDAVVNIYGGTVQHTVYGAGEGVFGETGYTWDTISGFIMGSSTVNLLAGTVNNVFGGGRNAVNAGGATVNVGLDNMTVGSTTYEGITINGNVYGANNHNGTPLGDVMVHVYKTKQDYYPQTPPAPYTQWTAEALHANGQNQQYAIEAVYGGGNESNYTPGAFLKQSRTLGKTTVYVHNCSNTIREVYGGANAANVGTTSVNADSYVIVEGGRIHKVFGGGKGDNASSHNVAANTYGTANTEIQGGLIDAVFGGGNLNGSVLATNLVIYDSTSITLCDILIDSIFGGSNEAPTTGDITTTIACSDGEYENIYGGSNNASITGDVVLNVLGSKITNVFGGSKGNADNAANIDGNVTLNLYGGEITNAFGGSDENGNITGVVTVNVLDTVHDCALDLINVYGGSKNATLTANSGVTASPVVNIVHGTVKGNVFGGSLGTTAATVSNPVVNIGYDATTMSNPSLDSAIKYLPTNLPVGTLVDSVRGNVYGGGSLASLEGDATVNVNRGVVGVITYGKKHGNTSAVLDTIIHAPNSGMVFGGGKGSDTDLDNDYVIAKVTGDTRVNIKGGHVLYSVYGGGELASVSDSAFVTVTGGQVGPAPRVETGYNIPIGLNGTDGYVLGGGKGIGNEGITSTYPYGAHYKYADVQNTLVTVNIPESADTTHNRIWGSIFGGAEDGHVTNNANVRYMSGTMGTKGTTSYDGNIFGGGRNYSKKNYTAGRVGGNIKVEMSGGQLLGSIFGGGRLALTGVNEQGAIQTGNTVGNVKVIVKGGKVGNQNLIEKWTASSMGDVYGGGKGSMEGIEGHDPASALLISLTKNTEVIIKDTVDANNQPVSPIIYGSVFGGGEVANVGSYTWNTSSTGAISNIQPVAGTGLAKVTVSGGRIGLDKMRMSYDLTENTDVGHVFGGGEGVVVNEALSPLVNGDNDTLVNLMATVLSTEVTISDNAWVKGSVYGGAENGHVRGNTWVKIQGGQIGSGEQPGNTPEVKFTENEFLTADSLPECPHWPFGSKDALGNTQYNPHDILDVENHIYPSDGHTFFGNVFGGGSGYYPYIVTSSTGEKTEHWNRHSGEVLGNTKVEISGGHILTSVYGGNEVTDVYGDSTVVIMTGGTLGVPRKLGQIGRHPVTCYLFGAGKGDPRTNFNNWTNVNGVRVEVSGGWIYGSVFGGGEEGHVIKDVKLIVKGNTGTNEQAIAGTATKIGTLGYSYVDGNIFGAGRGFSGEALTAGGVKGNVNVNIRGGEMLGSIYGGGRLASVGYDFVPATLDNGDPNPAYGQMLSGDEHGIVTVNISGGVIGNDYESMTQNLEHTKGGNVFAGAMGRIEKLDGTTNDIWPNLARVKKTILTISGNNTIIKGNVYGGSELGSITDSTRVTISGGNIWRDVYAGGYGSDDMTKTGKLKVFGESSGTPTVTDTVVTPMYWAGRVEGNTKLTVSGGWIKKSVYGGGEMASLGTIKSFEKHESPHPFIYSWPYKLVYKDNTGIATVNIKGGRIGITGKDFMGPWKWMTPSSGGAETWVPVDENGNELVVGTDEYDDAEQDNGDVYGGSKGKSLERYDEAFLANINKAIVNINYTNITGVTPATFKPTDTISTFFATANDFVVNSVNYGTRGCITGALYGGGENGHVNNNTEVTLTKGLIGHNLYGGGKGKGKYLATVLGYDDPQEIYSITAGKVYGNTIININATNNSDAYVVRNVYGGGNMASVGIGNYAGDDYYPEGYGEPQAGSAYSSDTLNSGSTYIIITGGTIGMLPVDPTKPKSVFKDDVPYGSVFGGCRGIATADVDPAHTSNLFGYRPDVFLSYVNNTHVKIGANNSTSGPVLYGSVYGGGQDGHIRYDANTVINSGTIGANWGSDNVGSNDINSVYWTERGNVFGGGSGIGTYKDHDVKYNSSVAGSITQNANLTVNGGTIYRNVYGGGNLATIGPPRVNQTYDCPIDMTCVTTIINADANIGPNSEYGGYVYGGSRGRADNTGKYENFALTGHTVVNIKGATIPHDVFGGGENGQVGVAGGDLTAHSSTVNIKKNSLIGSSTYQASVYGGGQGMWGETGYENDTISGRVMGLATVNIDGGEVKGNVYGGGKLGITYDKTYVNISGGTVDNHVFGGAYGQKEHIHVLGLRTVNMRKGLVKGNVYGGSFKADDALEAHPVNFANNDATETVSVVNYSGGTTNKHVFGAGDMGKSYGSTYVFIGTNAIMNAPHHTATTSGTYNESFYTSKRGDLIIDYDVWAGADFSDPNGSGEFDTYTITGRSEVYIDGTGYDTENGVTQNDSSFMLLRRSVFGCGTLNDGGHQGKQIMIRNYGKVISNSGTTDPENYIDATRLLVSIQYADSVIVESSHFRLQGRGLVNSNTTTEQFAIYNIFDDVRLVNGSSLFVDKPVNNIGNLHSNLSANLANHQYPATPVYTEVNYDGLTTEATDNKIRINRGGYITVSITSLDNSGAQFTEYGAVRGFFHLMTDGDYNAFAYARPKQSDAPNNHIAEAYNYSTDGGFVSYSSALNTFNEDGGLDGILVQMPYENHAPTRGERYFRVWRFKESGSSVLELVLHAIAKPNSNGYSYYVGTLTLPPKAGDGAVYKFKKTGNVADINYGSEIATVNAGLQAAGDLWMYYNTTTGQFVKNLAVDNTNLASAQTFMVAHPNNVFGLTAIPAGSLEGGSPVLINNEANNGIVAAEWTTTTSDQAPKVSFLLTHSDKISGNYAWDPLSLTLIQQLGETVTDEVTINVQIVTSTLIDQDNEVKTYAMMTHAHGTGDSLDIYKAKVLLPAYSVLGDDPQSTWVLKKVTWNPSDIQAPNGDTFDQGTLVEGCDYLNYTDTRNYVGMTMYTADNVDNVNGWYDPIITQANELDLGALKMVGTTNPITSHPDYATYGGICLGITRGENPISFDFDLHYDSDQNIGIDGNAEMGVLELMTHFDNYKTPEGTNVTFFVHVYRRGKGKGFYIDGEHGQFNYSGAYPDAAQPSLAGILHFAESYEPVDSIYIVNKVTAKAVNNLEWSTPYNQLKIFRYNGGHPLHRDVVDEFDDIHYKDYLSTYGNNPAYKGVLVDVLTSMSVNSAYINGAYSLEEWEGRPKVSGSDTAQYVTDHVISNAPLFNLVQGASLVISGANGHPILLTDNYNQAGNGGAVNLASGAILKMNRNAEITDNYVKDGVEEHHGGGAYLEGDAAILVSDDVQIIDNTHVSAAETNTPENVYLNDYNTLIRVGTGDGSDTYGELNATSKIGVTKTAWRDGQDYMPVVYTEYNPHGNNLLTDSRYAASQIIFDQLQKYGLFEYPLRESNDDYFCTNKLYFIKTWVDYVTASPVAEYHENDIDTPEKLAWAISLVNGYNSQTAEPNTNFTLTGDIDMGKHIWVPIGTTDHPYNGIFDGDGHVVTGVYSPLTFADKGMFGTANGATIKNLVAWTDMYNGRDVNNLGGIVGYMEGGTLSNCESAGYVMGGNDTKNIGGLVGKTSSTALVHSSFSTDTLHTVNNSAAMGGLVGSNAGKLFNAYSNFIVDNEGHSDTIGGLVGVNRASGLVDNCYSVVDGVYSIAHTNKAAAANIANCYSNSADYMNGSTVMAEDYGTFGAVKGRKEIGYIYDDNLITTASGDTTAYVPKELKYPKGAGKTHSPRWPGLVSALNDWVKANPQGLPKAEVAPWFRPTTDKINGDLPVLGFVKDSTMATLDADDAFLYYSSELDTLLRVYNKKDVNASIFLYGNATEVDSVPNDKVKVFVNEDAVLMQSASAIAEDKQFGNTTVGVTFDNSSRSAQDAFLDTLKYDWHLLSTPLSDAKLGITYDDSIQSNYWYNYDPGQVTSVKDSYMPDDINLQDPNDENSCKWDFYCYYEPEYHWINFKRNSKSHHHYDYPYAFIDYKNDSILVRAKGYMMAISKETYLSNTGTLNKGEITIPITTLSHYDPTDNIYNKGSNLVGNPYQAYLDLDNVAALNTELNKFWVYDADVGTSEAKGTYVPYTPTASPNPATSSQYLHPHQGFFVVYKADDPDTTRTTMTITPSMAGIKKDDYSYFRKEKKTYPLVNIFAQNEEGNLDLTIVEVGRPEVGGVEKIYNLQNTDFKIYTRFDETNYGLLFTPVGTKKVPLFFKTPTDGTYTFKWNTFNGTFKMLKLIDNITGGEYDMLTRDSYSFTSHASDYAARFYIVFEVDEVIDNDDDDDNNNNFAFFDGTNWVIDGEGQLELIDVTGRVLYSNTVSGEQSRVSFNDYAAGTYMLRLIKGRKDIKAQKIVLY